MAPHQKNSLIPITLTLLPTCCIVSAADVTINVDTRANHKAISPYIYGANQYWNWEYLKTNDEHFTAQRFGGNRNTSYNWENNASNAGSDWIHHSDHDLPSKAGVSSSRFFEPGVTLVDFHDRSLAKGYYSLIQLSMAGYVAADTNGTVTTTAPSSRWIEVKNRKTGALALNPDTTDRVMYIQEELNFLVNKYGTSSAGRGVRGYALDNEPALWNSTQNLIHPTAVTFSELITKSTELALLIKEMDPGAEVFGPVSFGFNELSFLTDYGTWSANKGSYTWFVEYYFDKMRQASATAGKRLLDVFDFHWYPESRGSNRIVMEQNSTLRDNVVARLAAPRGLWDRSYRENSWIGSSTFDAGKPLLPDIIKARDTYYPGTKIGITEFSFGAEGHISGALAMIDVLGIFGVYGIDYAFYWNCSYSENLDNTFIRAAYRFMRNVNGSGAAFGSISVKATNNDSTTSSAYAALSDEQAGQISVVVINKDLDNPLNATIKIASDSRYSYASVFALEGASTAIALKQTTDTLTANQIKVSLAPLSAVHIIFGKSSAIVSVKQGSAHYTSAARDGRTGCEAWFDIRGRKIVASAAGNRMGFPGVVVGKNVSNNAVVRFVNQ